MVVNKETCWNELVDTCSSNKAKSIHVQVASSPVFLPSHLPPHPMKTCLEKQAVTSSFSSSSPPPPLPPPSPLSPLSTPFLLSPRFRLSGETSQAQRSSLDNSHQLPPSPSGWGLAIRPLGEMEVRVYSSAVAKSLIQKSRIMFFFCRKNMNQHKALFKED